MRYNLGEVDDQSGTMDGIILSQVNKPRAELFDSLCSLVSSNEK